MKDDGAMDDGAMVGGQRRISGGRWAKEDEWLSVGQWVVVGEGYDRSLVGEGGWVVVGCVVGGAWWAMSGG